MNFISKIKNFCLKQKLFKHADRILIGVSGGPDSVALLYILYALRHRFGLQLYIAHLNHGLRREAKDEQSYVKELAQKLGIPLFTKTIKLQRTKGSLEEIAREARLKFLIESAKKIKADSIALGHHQDDLAETVLMRILRGTGPWGIKSILPKRKINEMIFIRPLLETNRYEIKKFLRTKRIRFCTDASNKDTVFLRNKIRQHLLPLLEKTYNPNIKNTLIHLSQSISLAHDYLKNVSERILSQAQSKASAPNVMMMNLAKISNCHPAILRETIRLAIEKLLGHTRQLTFAHVEAIEHLINDQPKDGSIVHLPSGLVITKKGDFLIFKTTLDKTKKHVIIA